MPIAVTCQACGQTFNLRKELAGKTVRCRCGRPLPVPGASNDSALTSLLKAEFAESYRRPPVRKAPVYRSAPRPKRSGDRAKAPATSALGKPYQESAPAPPSKWPGRLRLVLRVVVGAAGLVYGLFMLGLGGRTLLYMSVMVYIKKAADFPWVHVADFMIAFCGLLLSVGCVGLLMGRRQSGMKSQYAAGMLATLWIVLACLDAIVKD